MCRDRREVERLLPSSSRKKKTLLLSAEGPFLSDHTAVYCRRVYCRDTANRRFANVSVPIRSYTPSFCYYCPSFSVCKRL